MKDLSQPGYLLNVSEINPRAISVGMAHHHPRIGRAHMAVDSLYATWYLVLLHIALTHALASQLC